MQAYREPGPAANCSLAWDAPQQLRASVPVCTGSTHLRRKNNTYANTMSVHHLHSGRTASQ